MSTNEFISEIGEQAREDMKKTGILASLTLAQAILESSWGKSELAEKAKNLFGIKATTAWTGNTYSVVTNECYDGVNLERVQAVFRAYGTWAESIADHSAFLQADRYAKVVGETDYKVACQEVKNANYATDTDYVSKLVSLIERYGLYEYDKAEEKEEKEEKVEEEVEEKVMKKIMLDAGHYGTYNRSKVTSTYTEGEVMWKLHLLLKKALENRGFMVDTTRSTQSSDLAVYNRGTLAKGYDCFLSLHSNGVDGSETTDYPVVFHSVDGKNAGLAQNFATKIQEIMGTRQTGQGKTYPSNSGGEYLGVMRGAAAVGCPLYMLIEHSFHSNTKASAWLMVDSNLEKMAEMEADVLAVYYGASATTSAEVTSTTVEYLVRKTCSDQLNIRSGPGVSFGIVGAIEDSKSYTIVAEENGWGKLKSGVGWVCLVYTQKV